ncbi:MAG: DUF4325 domain-containing protein [Pseudolysinimonas sp.]|uniref:STAS-like domain-containing protein n=1 Tax=Pseudolysinimonas sp. TaxID=2680009 RepID=UPI0032632725
MSDLVSIGELSANLGLPIKTLRRLADRGEIPSSVSAGGHRRFDLEGVRTALATTDSTMPARPPEWSSRDELDGLSESDVWLRARTGLEIDGSTDAGRAATYAFTEMLNNAIDHSGSQWADSEVWSTSSAFAFRIRDHGDGVFAHLQSGLGLSRPIEAAAELTKGKRTTWRERHSGEGIFFTSKVAGVFRLSANGLRLTVDNLRGDVALGVSPVRIGTLVEFTLPLPPARTLRSVFEEFTTEDRGFVRSRPTVKLFGTGLAFISRSEARRLMEGMEAFDDIDLDFAGVDDVGQGFVDELLRVWPSEHGGVRLVPTNMNEAVEFMVNRARRG